MIFTMHFILQSSLLSAVLLGIANAVAVDLQKRDSPLEVTLAPSGNAVVKATVKNVGTTDLKLLTYGTLFDEAPVEKVDVYTAGTLCLIPETESALRFYSALVHFWKQRSFRHRILRIRCRHASASSFGHLDREQLPELDPDLFHQG